MLDEFFDHYLDYAEPGAGRPAPLGPAGWWEEWWRRRWMDCGADPVGRLAREQGFVITIAQLAGCGVPRHRARTELRAGRWTHRRHGVVSPLAFPVAADVQLARRRLHALDAAAAALVLPRHVVSGRSAAVLHGLPTLAVPELPELTTAPDDGVGRRYGSRLRDAQFRADEVTQWFGADVLVVPRTIVDLARRDRRDGLMAADAALRERLTTRAAICDSLSRSRGWPGVRQARAVLALADPRAESPLESVVRLALHDDGFPPPELQTEIAGYPVDFYWPEKRFVLQADGRGKYEGERLWNERRRDAAVRRAGCRVDRVIWADVTRYWPLTRIRLADQLGLRLPR